MKSMQFTICKSKIARERLPNGQRVKQPGWRPMQVGDLGPLSGEMAVYTEYELGATMAKLEIKCRFAS